MNLKLPMYDILKFALPVLSVIIAVVAGMTFSGSLPQSYDATARLWIQAHYPNTGLDSTSTGVYVPLGSFFNNPIKTSAELMKSEEVMRHALEDLKKVIPESSMPTVGQMKKNIATEEVKDTDVLAVKYSGPTPEISLQTLKAIVDGFLWVNSNQSTASATRSRQFLEQQRELAQQRLDKIISRLKDFRHAEGISDVDKRVQALLAAMAETETAAENYKSEIASRKELLRYFAAQGEAEPLLQGQDMPNDPIVSQLRQSLSQAEMQKLSLTSRLKPEHPTMVALNDRISVIQTHLEKQINQLRASSPQAVITSSGDSSQKSRSTLQAEIVSWESKLVTATARLKKLQNELHLIPSKQVEYAELVRAEGAALEHLDSLEKNYENARLVESVASGVTNIQIIDKPRVSGVPTGPGKAVMLAASLVGGCILGASVFLVFLLLDPRLVSVSKLLQNIDYPVLGSCSGLLHAQDIKEDMAAYERLRLTLASTLEGKFKQICVMSVGSGVGKSAVASGLALNFQNSGKSVVLIDLGGKPRLRKIVKELIPAQTGARRTSHEGVNLDWIDQVAIIDAENNPEIIEKTWTTAEAGRLLKLCEEAADLTIIDTESLENSSTALSLCTMKVFPLIVMRYKMTQMAEVRFLAGELSLLHISSAGLVVTGGMTNVVSEAQKIRGVETPQPVEKQAQAASSVWS